MKRKRMEGGSSDSRRAAPGSAQHAWTKKRKRISVATEWIIKQRWQYLVNQLRLADNSLSRSKHRIDDYSFLQEMNAAEIPDSLEDSSRAFIGEHAVGSAFQRNLDAERFIGELTSHFFVNIVSSGKIPTRSKLERLWRKAISETLIIYAESSVIEILSHAKLEDEFAAASFAETVKVVRDFRGNEKYTNLLSDDFCIACFRRCFSNRAAMAGKPGIAENVAEEHFPFLSETASNKVSDNASVQRFIDEHEALLAALNYYERFLGPITAWFLNLNAAVDQLDPRHAEWVDELRYVIFGTATESWVMRAPKLVDVIVASQALINPKSRRHLRPIKPEGHYWHLIDLGCREFLSTVISRSQRLSSETSTLKAVWLQRRVEWVWWQALFSGAKNLNGEVLDGLKRRDVAIANISANSSPESRIEQIFVNGKPSQELGKTRSENARVTIFGGGIAGLTAAHELCERGFDVVVIEKQEAGYATREKHVQVGGIARTQWDGVERFPEPVKNPEERRKYPRHPDAANKVPGEHGYRFFPSFYRHIFDTMKRTPIRSGDEDQLKPPHLTAFDQLQGTYEQVFARKENYVNLSRTRPRSLEGLRKEYMQLINGLGFKQRDVARFLFKLIRYLMSCSERRSAEYEDISMLEFFGGEEFYHEEFIAAIRAAPQALVAMDAEHGDARTQLNVYLQLLMDQVLGGDYTDNTLRGPTSDVWFVYWREYLEEMGVEFYRGNLLSIVGLGDSSFETIIEWPEKPNAERAAVSCEQISARISASDYVVMALDALEVEKATSRWPSNGVPADLRRYTSYVTRTVPADSYRYELVAHCRDRVVDIAIGNDMLVWLLSRIHLISVNGDDGLQAVRSTLASMLELTGEVRERRTKAEDLRIVFWMAQQVAPRILRQLESFIGECIAGSEFHSPKFVSDSPEFINTETRVESPRVPTEQFGAHPDDRFQTFTGIQYYFEQDFRLVRGHVYLPDTEWGLSVISQRQFWSESSRELDGVKLRGILSVDIGDTRRVSSFTGKSFLASASKEEVAAEVWRQIEDSLKVTRGESARVTNLPLPKPKYFHVDENLEFDGQSLKRNLTPFLVNNVGDWESRPKCMPWVPGTVAQVMDPTDATDVWQAPHGGYRIHENKVVFCGHYMRTFTRMTTMEAANESARHAVNAILDHLSRYGLRQDYESNGIKVQSIFGDYCEIWNVESHELEDFNYFKRIDKMLFERGKPHLADILRFDHLADVIHPEPTDLQALLAAFGSTTTNDLGIGANELIMLTSSLVKASQSLNSKLVKSSMAPGLNVLEPLNNAILSELDRFKN